VSSEPKWPEVNTPEAPVPPLGRLCVPRQASPHSPIDDYYTRVSEMVSRSSKPEVAKDEVLLRLLLLEVFAAAELYFRRVLVGTVGICPYARTEADARSISFGAVSYYEPESLAFALFEGQSFAGSGEVKRLTDSITGISLPGNSSVWAALQAFEQICHIRHASSHACGELGSRNLAGLGVVAKGVQCIVLDVLEFQRLVARAHSAVRAYNKFMFGALLGRWKEKGLIVGRWADDKPHFQRLHALFYSRIDGVGESNPERAHAGLAALMAK